MNFKSSESAQKLRGGYYTSPDIAAFLSQWVLEKNPREILEPSCGNGVFLDVLGKLTYGCRSKPTVVGFEIEPTEAAKSREAARAAGLAADIRAKDFLSWAVTRFAEPRFDAVVGNPPFIRYQYLDPALQTIAERIFSLFRLPFTKHTNAWVSFVVSSIALLKAGGRLAMVVPSELLHILHAQSLRRFLSASCSRVLVIDPRDLWFEGTLQGAVLLLAEKGASKEKVHGVAVLPAYDRTFLSTPASTLFETQTFSNGAFLDGKWMVALLTRHEQSVLEKAQRSTDIARFKDVADVDVGIVTGANRFFLVPDSVVEKFKLHRWAFPMFGRSEHVPGVIYDKHVHDSNRANGLPTNFLWFDTDRHLEDFPWHVAEYLRTGEAQELPNRFKCRVRSPWYRVPSVYATRVGMLKRSHDFPRLIYNALQAFTTDTAYRIRPKAISSQSLVVGFVNSLTALTAELEGRHYGGGVLELVPSEIEKLLIPVVSKSLRQTLHGLDKLVRERTAAEEILRLQDEAIFPLQGFDLSDSEVLRETWRRLRDRRHRTLIPAPSDDLEKESVA